jgi:threonine synthase
MDETGMIHKPADLVKMREEIYSVSISDEETRKTIGDAYKMNKLLLEPHGAVGWAGLIHFLEEHPGLNSAEQLCFSLETAHPAKFPAEINRILGIEPALPPSLQGIDDKPEMVIEIANDYAAFKSYLLKS